MRQGDFARLRGERKRPSGYRRGHRLGAESRGALHRSRDGPANPAVDPVVVEATEVGLHSFTVRARLSVFTRYLLVRRSTISPGCSLAGGFSAVVSGPPGAFDATRGRVADRVNVEIVPCKLPAIAPAAGP